MKEWEVFHYQRACFSERQNTTYMEGSVLLIFSKDKVRRALLAICSDTPAQLQSDKCVRVVPPFRTKFLSTAFKQWRSSAMPRLRCLNKDVVVLLSSFHTNRNKLKGRRISIEIILASHHCDLRDFAGKHDFG